MNKIYTLLILALFLCVSTAKAQVPSLRAYEKAAKKEMNDKNYYAAMKYYSLALRKLRKDKDTTSHLYLMYNMAEAAREFKAFDKARDSYKYVLTKKPNEYHVANYWLAKVCQQQAEYDTAVYYFEKYLSPALTTKGPNSNYDSSMEEAYKIDAQKSIESCIWAKGEMSYPASGYNIKPFGDNVNTEWSEFAPVEHENKVYYSSITYDKDNYCPTPENEISRLYSPPTSTSQSKNTSSIMSIEGGSISPVNQTEEKDGKYIAHTAFNGEYGDKMFYTVCEKANAADFNCEIFYRKRNESGFWGDEIRLPEHVNLKGSNNTQPNIGFDGETELLFFVSNRPDSVGDVNGDMNIYCSVIAKDGKVGLPVKLKINTDVDDITPFYNKSEDNLYFSSKGYQGFGGFDIYKAVKDDYGRYVDPTPLPYPLNTSYDDIYFSTDEKFDNAYLASNRGGAVVCSEVDMETCCHDIFELEIIKVDLNVYTFNEEAKKLFEEGDTRTRLDSCYIGLYDLATGQEIKVEFSRDSNHAYFPLELGKEYQVTANHSNQKGRWTDTLDFVSTKGITETKTLYKNLDLNPNIEIWAFTYDKRTKEDLLGCNFKFYSEDSGKLIYETDRINDNILYRDRILSQFGKNYKVVASKEGYSSDSASYSTVGLYLPDSLQRRLYLEPNQPEIPRDFECVLYFDNDEPDSNTMAIISTVNYEESYNKYNVVPRVDTFMVRYGMVQGFGRYGEQAIAAQQEMKNWFDTDVAGGMAKLRKLAEYLDGNVTSNNLFQIWIEGSASPRSPKGYNLNLSKRRNHSVERYLSDYSTNLRTALREGRLQLIPVSKGELLSKGKNLEDDYDRPKSIYGLGESQERRVRMYQVKELIYPISIYFDNSQYSSTSTRSFEGLYNVLEDKPNERRMNFYKAENSKNLSGFDKDVAESDVENFFRGKLKDGLLDLRMIAEFLNKNKSKKYQLDIESSDESASNKVKGIENYLKRYEKGVLSRYISSGKLKINFTPTSRNSSGSSETVMDGFEQRKIRILGLTEIY